MRKTCAAAALVAAVLGGGCSADEGDDSGGAPVPSPPQVGECHDTPREVDSFGVGLVDAEPAVDCSEPHTLETTRVIDVAPGLGAYDAEGFMPECDKALWRYVDAKPFVSTVVGWIHIPSEEQRAAGQSWMRCDASIIRDAYGNAGQRTGSLRNAVGAHPERFVICVQTPQWRPEESLPLASCQRPHPWEFLPNLISVDEDLSEAARQREGLRLCTARAAVRPDADQLRIHLDLDVADVPAPPGRLPGLCRIERKSGLLPPLSDLYLWSP